MSNRKKEIIEWIYCAAIAYVVVMIITHFIGTLTVVKQESMYSTLKPGERLVLNKFPKTFKQLPKEGDIITFESPSRLHYESNNVDLKNPVAKYEKDPTTLWGQIWHNVLEIDKVCYIKRVIGLPGDHIQIKDGKVYKNDKVLNEPYLDNGTKTEATGAFSDIVVPDNAVFAMGDNRSVSMDCRAFGCIPMEKIESVVVIRVWPITRFGKVDKT